MQRFFSGLWKHPDFLKLWFGQTISEFGSRITRDGLPLTALLVLNATPAQMGLLVAFSSLPVLIFGLFAGVFVDRMPRRPIMIVCDLIRFGVLLTIPFAALTGRLTMTWVYIVAAIVAVFALIFDIAYRAYLPVLIARNQLVEGNSKLGTTDALAEIGGPAITGVLIQIMSAPLAILFDAFSFLASVFSVRTIGAIEPPPPARTDQATALRAVWIDLREGVRQIADDPVLRTLALGMGARAFFGSFIGTLYDIYTIRELGLTPVVLGALVACGGIGALIGSVLAGWLPKKIGMSKAILGALLVSGVINLCIPLAASDLRLAIPLMAMAQIIGDGAMKVYWINEVSERQLLIPDYLLGRVNAGFGFLGQGIAPFGALIAGALASATDVRLTLWIAVLGILITALLLISSPVRRLDAIPSIMMEESRG